MNLLFNRLPSRLAVLTAILLAGCGGGGGGSSGGGSGGGSSSGGDSTVPTPPSPPSVSGVAASGVAFEAATITVFDSTGAQVGLGAAPVGPDGRYLASYSSSAISPLLVVASRTNRQGAVETLVGLAPATALSGATANVTPVTTLIASLLGRSGDPARLPAELADKAATLSQAAIASKTAQVQALLAPVLDATQTRGIDPLAATFPVDGTGYDRLLDTLKITIIPASSTSANIEIALRTKLPDGASPTATRFTSQDAASASPVPAVAPDVLVEAGTSMLITNLLSRATACYTQPIGQRVAPGGSSAADITSATCKGLFPANAPGAFKDNGSLVGAGRSFAGIFSADATGTLFSQGNYEFTRANGDVLVAFKTTSPLGDESYASLFARKDADGSLKFIGNQYAYHGAVFPWEQLRRFIKQSPGSIDYLSTGYNVTINNVTGGAGTGGSIYQKVVVTGPFGDAFSYKPTAGTSTLQLEAKPGTNIIRLRNEYVDATNAADPCVLDSSMLCLDPTRFSNAYIQAIPANTTWRFDYYLAGNASATPDAVQYFTTRARALTLPEFRTQGLPDLAADDIARIRGNLSPADGFLPLAGLTSFTMQYTVPQTAVPPFTLSLFGRAAGVGLFDDSVAVASYARQGTIPCTSNGAADTHCASSPSAYVASAGAVSLQLIGRDAAGRYYSSYYGLYMR